MCCFFPSKNYFRLSYFIFFFGFVSLLPFDFCIWVFLRISPYSISLSLSKPGKSKKASSAVAHALAERLLTETFSFNVSATSGVSRVLVVCVNFLAWAPLFRLAIQAPVTRLAFSQVSFYLSLILIFFRRLSTVDSQMFFFFECLFFFLSIFNSQLR